MRVCLAQVRSEKGAVRRNVARHLAALHRLAPRPGDLVVFPELSLSNYDPDVAAASSVDLGDRRLIPLQEFSDSTGSVISVGAPVRSSDKPMIAQLVFSPNRPLTVVGKTHLHADEYAYFAAAPGGPVVLDLAAQIGVAICYEISVSEHAAALTSNGAEVYVASVAKTPRGIERGWGQLAKTAVRHQISALVVNSVGMCEGKKAGGGSAVFDQRGELVQRLGAAAEGYLIFDTVRGMAYSKSATR